MCSTAFGAPVEPGREQRDREVAGPGHRASAAPAGRRAARRPGSMHDRGHRPRRASRRHRARPRQVVHRRGDRAEPPARAIAGAAASAQLGSCHATTSPRRTPAAPQPARDRARSRGSSPPAARRRASARPTARPAAVVGGAGCGGTSRAARLTSAAAASFHDGPAGGRALQQVRADEVALDLDGARADAQPADVAVRRARPGTRGRSRSRRAAGSPRRTRTWPRGWPRSSPSRSRAPAACRAARPGARRAAAAGGRASSCVAMSAIFHCRPWSSASGLAADRALVHVADRVLERALRGADAHRRVAAALVVDVARSAS